MCNSDFFKFKGGNIENFNHKLENLVKNPELLEKYWENHPPLKTMKKHVQELIEIYQKKEVVYES